MQLLLLRQHEKGRISTGGLGKKLVKRVKVWVCDRYVCIGLRFETPNSFDALPFGRANECWLTSGSGASTYPANRDFKGCVGGVRGTAPQGFFYFSIFSIFFVISRRKGDVLTNI